MTPIHLSSLSDMCSAAIGTTGSAVPCTNNTGGGAQDCDADLNCGHFHRPTGIARVDVSMVAPHLFTAIAIQSAISRRGPARRPPSTGAARHGSRRTGHGPSRRFPRRAGIGRRIRVPPTRRGPRPRFEGQHQRRDIADDKDFTWVGRKSATVRRGSRSSRSPSPWGLPLGQPVPTLALFLPDPCHLVDATLDRMNALALLLSATRQRSAIDCAL